MRVLVIHTGGSQLRGSEFALLALLAGLDRTEFDISVWCTDQVMLAPLAAMAVPTRVGSLPQVVASRGGLRLPLRGYARGLWQLARYARRESVDLLYCSGGAPCQVAVPIGKVTGAAVVCFLHHPAPRYYHYSWLTPLVRTLVFPSTFTAAHTQAAIGHSGEVVNLGIDARQRFVPRAPRDVAPRTQLGYTADNVVFGQIGALVPHKGHRLLIEAFAGVVRQVPEARLFIIGTGPERSALESLVLHLHLEGVVHFAGYVDDTLPYLQHVLDVNVLASSEEGLGLVNVEAGACALPSVSIDATGIREGVLHGETGLLSPPGDAAALSANLLLLARDPALRDRMGKAARRFVLERFDMKRYRERMQQILREAFAQSRRGAAARRAAT